MDRYLSALLAPRQARADLLALTAFLGEVARIPDLVTEPAMGEIRLQWWRDALDTLRAGRATGNPIADALGGVIVRRQLPDALLQSVIDARSEDLVPSGVSAEQAHQGDPANYLQRSDGAAFRLAARVLGINDQSVGELLSAAGQAYGRTRLLRAFARRGGVAVEKPISEARQALADVRLLTDSAPAAVIPAILPVALVEPYLAALEGHDKAANPADISQLARVWSLLRASLRGRV
jgi:phytoene synthase